MVRYIYLIHTWASIVGSQRWIFALRLADDRSLSHWSNSHDEPRWDSYSLTNLNFNTFNSTAYGRTNHSQKNSHTIILLRAKHERTPKNTIYSYSKQLSLIPLNWKCQYQPSDRVGYQCAHMPYSEFISHMCYCIQNICQGRSYQGWYLLHIEDKIVHWGGAFQRQMPALRLLPWSFWLSCGESGFAFSDDWTYIALRSIFHSVFSL